MHLENMVVSEVYFRKLFLKHMNTSPKQYIIDIRLQKAKQLLAEGVFSISAISEKCGFSNPYHFCRIFKDRIGIPPLRIQKRKHNKYDIRISALKPGMAFVPDVTKRRSSESTNYISVLKILTKTVFALFADKL